MMAASDENKHKEEGHDSYEEKKNEEVQTNGERQESTSVRERRPKFHAPPPDALEYNELGPVSRTLHWHDYVTCSKDGEFKCSRTDKSYKTLIPNEEGYVWFRALRTNRDVTDNDWFGNVRCSFDLEELLSKYPDINMIYIDTAYFGFSSASRILLTKKDSFENYRKLEKNSLKYGDPILFKDGKFFTLEMDLNRKKTWWGKHTTEFIIDITTVSSKEIFEICKKESVDHSKANSVDRNNIFRKHMCLIYNTNVRQLCPASWTVDETQKVMDKLNSQSSSYEMPYEVPEMYTRPKFSSPRNRRGYTKRVFRGKRREFQQEDSTPETDSKTVESPNQNQTSTQQEDQKTDWVS